MMNATQHCRRTAFAVVVRIWLSPRGTKQFPLKPVSKSVRGISRATALRPAKSAMLGSNTGGDVVEIYDHPILICSRTKVSPFYDGYNFNIPSQDVSSCGR